MRRTLVTVVIVLLAFAAGEVARGIATSAPTSSGHRAPRSQAPAPPILHESFTLLTCDQSTTIGLEGCAEAEVLHFDALINQQRRVIFRTLVNRTTRQDFVTAETSWQRSRRLTCVSASDLYGGGSFAPVAFANCLVTLNRAHLTALDTLYLPAGTG
ncbi:MAG TPA: lysozyme inhibitor LprI family protein [Acidimicrobiales bacterium]